MIQESLFPERRLSPSGKRLYLPIFTVTENRKGVLDCDTVKGCTCGMSAYPGGGCYGECYAAKTANQYGIDFTIAVSRKPVRKIFTDCFFTVKNHKGSWYRIGTAGDPCHDWDNTILICELLKNTGKIPVIITKHWISLSDENIDRLRDLNAVVNTSTSGMDTDSEISFRVGQARRLRESGIRSIHRIVTCFFGSSSWANQCKEKQEYLLSLDNIIDNPLRTDKSNNRVINGDIILTRRDESIGGGSKFVSLHNPNVYLGTCTECPDQCGVESAYIKINHNSEVNQCRWIY